MRSLIIIAVLTLITGYTVHAQNSYLYTTPEKADGEWPVKSIHELSVDTARIHAFFDQMSYTRNKLLSVLLVVDGKLVVEEYLNDEKMNRPHDLRSVTKSIRSLLVGVALEQGLIEDVNDPILKYLKQRPEKNPDPKKDKITIHHLLTMSTGFDCNDWDKKSPGQEDRVYRKKNWIQYTIDLPMRSDPGGVSLYCSMGTVLLAEIIEQTSGMTIDEFTQVHLFDPLGITQVEWGHTRRRNVPSSARRLYLRPRDMAKIGQLVLDGGVWDGKQVVPAEWITVSTMNQTRIGGVDYGYLWWNFPFSVNDKQYESITAAGNGGQYIMIIPELNMVGVFTGGAYNSEEDKFPFAIMRDVFLATFGG